MVRRAAPQRILEKSLAAGRLNRVVDIETPTVTIDSTGAAKKTWAHFKRVRAAMRPYASDESLALGPEQLSQTTVQFIMRYVKGLSKRMRLVFEGRTFEIVGMFSLDEARRWHVVSAIERD